MDRFYVGIDLHSRSMRMCVIGEDGKRVCERTFACELMILLEFLRPYGTNMVIAVESTNNWYWLVDGLMGAGYDVRLAHSYGLSLITKAKVKTDRRDARRLARYLRLDDLPEGYIYPKEQRPHRDLLRRRTSLVQFRSATLAGIRMQLKQYNRDIFSAEDLKKIDPEVFDREPLPEPVILTCRFAIQRANLITDQIREMERRIRRKTRQQPEFKILKTLPGVDNILGMTIHYEVGDIARFPSDRDFASYCRVVPPASVSAGKASSGTGRRQGNPYLRWAYGQAAIAAIRYYPDCRRFRDRHLNRRSGPAARLISNCIVAHKLNTASFFMLRDCVPFDPTKMFN